MQSIVHWDSVNNNKNTGKQVKGNKQHRRSQTGQLAVVISHLGRPPLKLPLQQLQFQQPSLGASKLHLARSLPFNSFAAPFSSNQPETTRTALYIYRRLLCLLSLNWLLFTFILLSASSSALYNSCAVRPYSTSTLYHGLCLLAALAAAAYYDCISAPEALLLCTSIYNFWTCQHRSLMGIISLLILQSAHSPNSHQSSILSGYRNQGGRSV